MLQKTTHLRISAPRSPNVSDGDAFCTVPAMRNACLQSLFKRLAAAMVLKLLQNTHAWLTFDKVQNPLRLPRKTASGPQKLFQDHKFLPLLTSKRLSRQSDVHFFNISTSKSAPSMRCFVRFDFEMCFVPTAACILSTAHLPKVFQTRLFKHFGLDVHFVNRSPAKSAPDVWCFLAFLTSKSASRHTGVQFFISSRQTTPHPPLQWAFRSHKN